MVPSQGPVNERDRVLVEGIQGVRIQEHLPKLEIQAQGQLEETHVSFFHFDLLRAETGDYGSLCIWRDVTDPVDLHFPDIDRASQGFSGLGERGRVARDEITDEADIRVEILDRGGNGG